MKKELICIRCPLGCRLTAEWTGDFESFRVTGNRCPRGAAYAGQELKDPRRIVTAVVKSNSKQHPYLPVRTNRELPKKQIAPLLNHLYSLTVTVPVKRGGILLKNYGNSGVDIIFSNTTEE